MRDDKEVIKHLLSMTSLYKEERLLLLLFIKDLTVILKDESQKRDEDVIITSLLNIISSFSDLLRKKYLLEDKEKE